MDLARFAKNVWVALVLLALVVAIDRAQFPLAQQLDGYIDYVLNTALDLEPVAQLAQKLNLPAEWLSLVQ